jgi:hypothetical protein
MDWNSTDFFIWHFLGFLVSGIAAWMIGLTPALILRYEVYKRPIHKKIAFRRFAPITIALALIYMVVINELARSNPFNSPFAYPYANQIHWWIIYYVGKWILTKGYVYEESDSKKKPMTPPLVLLINRFKVKCQERRTAVRDFCADCQHFQLDSGFCNELSLNVVEHPFRFERKCGGGKFAAKQTSGELEE